MGDIPADPDPLCEKIHAFYEMRHEEDRLGQGIGPLEQARTQQIIRDCLPAGSVRVADVGGGPGEYAFWLSEIGHQVDLFDLVPRHLDVARERNLAVKHPLRLIQQADARGIPAEADSYDLVLVHGPLYHLPERRDRIQVLEEARRIATPGGLVLAFGISYTASAIVGLQQEWVFEPGYFDMIVAEVNTGVHAPPASFPRCFVDGYFHRPGELEQEARDAGLTPKATLAVEGPSWLVPDFAACWQDPLRRARLLDISRLLERDCYNSPHFVVPCLGTSAGELPAKPDLNHHRHPRASRAGDGHTPESLNR